MKNQFDYSKYECPYSHIEKDCGHELKGPEGYQDTYSVWCECGFSGPVFIFDPEQLKLKMKVDRKEKIPYTGFGDEALDNLSICKKGDLVFCVNCGDRHPLKCGTDKNGKETDSLMFYKCGEKTFLGAVAGKCISLK